MRKTARPTLGFIVKCLLLGFIFNLVVAYGIWVRTGLIQYDFDSQYWTTEQIGTGGWYREGSRFGVRSMASKTVESSLPMLMFVRDPQSGQDVVEQSMSIKHFFSVRDSYGWPIQSIKKSGSFHLNFFIQAGLTVHEIKMEPNSTVETTPDPRWYTTGIPTGMSSPYKTVPIATRPTGVVLNSLFYAVFIAGLVWIWKTFFGLNTKKKSRCFGCGKHIPDGPMCPVCGLERDKEC